MNISPTSAWFYAENQERKGPISFTTLQSLLAQGLPASSLVWTDGMAEWLPASSIPELTAPTAPSPGASSPYAPPSVEVSLAPTGNIDLGAIPDQPIPLDVGFCIGQAWKYTVAHFGKIFLFGLVYIVISFVVSAVLAGIGAVIEPPRFETTTMPNGSQFTFQTGGGGPVTFLINVISNIFSLFLSLGAIHFGHRLLKGESPEIGDLFSQGSKLLVAVGASIIFYIMFFVGLILLIFPGIWVALRFGFYLQAIVDKNLGPIEALKYSYHLTRQNALSLFGLYLLCILIVLAGTLALLIGLLWAIPVFWGASFIAYRYLHAGTNSFKVLA